MYCLYNESSKFAADSSEELKLCMRCPVANGFSGDDILLAIAASILSISLFALRVCPSADVARQIRPMNTDKQYFMNVYE